MITVIAQPQYYVLICETCIAVLEYDQEDVVFIEDPESFTMCTFNRTIKCPRCGEINCLDRKM